MFLCDTGLQDPLLLLEKNKHLWNLLVLALMWVWSRGRQLYSGSTGSLGGSLECKLLLHENLNLEEINFVHTHIFLPFFLWPRGLMNVLAVPALCLLKELLRSVSAYGLLTYSLAPFGAQGLHVQLSSHDAVKPRSSYVGWDHGKSVVEA